MSYPPPQGGYPFSQNQGPNNFGFSSSSQQGQGPGYPLYPQGGGGFPCPPSNPSYPGLSGQPSSGPSGSTPYNLIPGGASPYPAPSNTAPYQPLSSSSTPYSLQSSTYPPAPGISSSQPSSTPYPPAPGFSSYPPAQSSPPYPPAPGSSPYPPAPGSSPYPPAPGSSPYPPAPGSSPYPPAPGSSPYPPAPGSSPYPAQTGSPYSQSSSSFPSSASAAPYPPGYGSASYPPQSNASLPQTSQYPYSSCPGTSPLGAPPAQQSSYSQQSYSQSSQLTQGGMQGVMWPYQERPTLRPTMAFDASSDAAQLRKAMKGFGTDEATIIRILGRRTSKERQDILLRYQQSYGRDLTKDLKSELGGQLENVIVALMMPLPIFLAQQINKAISGLGTKESTLIEVLCANDNNAIRDVKAAYQHQYRKPLEADLRGDTSGDFGRLMVAMAAGHRDEMNTNASLAPGLAQELYRAGVKKMGTNEAEFSRILSVYSYPLLRCVFEEYKKVSGGKTFESAIRSELSGDYRDAMLALYECINNRAAFFAHYLNLAMKGFGTHDQTLIRIVVSRSEIDMGNIKDEYQRKYGKRLEDAIASETSGDYKKVLLAVVQG